MLFLRSFSIIIFFSVLAFFTIPYPNWGFDSDDAGFIWHGRITSLHDIPTVLAKGKLGTQLVFPSNYAGDTRTVLGGFHWYYRPLTLLFFGIQHLCFGSWAYGYFLIMILFHALSALLFFFMLYALFASYAWATWGSLFFAFHLSLGGWMGWIAAQQYTICMFLMMSSTILFIQTIKHKSVWYNVGACVCYGIATFLFEIAFVFPFFIHSLWFTYPWLKERLDLPLLSAISFTKNIGGLWATALVFLLTRGVMCSTGTTSNGSLGKHVSMLIQNVVHRKADLISFIVGAYNISFIPGGNQLLKGTIIIFISIVLFYAFVRCTHKKIILFCCFNIVLFLWPAVLKQYTLRYLYYALPFIIVMVIALILLRKNQHTTKKMLMVLVAMLIGNMLVVAGQLKQREALSDTRTNAINDLMQHHQIFKYPLCFVALPHHLFWTGLAQNIWLLRGNNQQPIFYDRSTFTRQNTVITNNHVSIMSIKNGHRFISHDWKKVYWTDFGGEETRLGTRTVLASNGGEEYDIIYHYNQQLLKQNPIFITWDYEKKCFKIIS